MEENSHNNFLQSDIWRKFQEAVGHRTFFTESGPAHNATHNEAVRGFSASIIEYQLPVVGKYFYIPRWPSTKQFSPPAGGFNEVIELAKKNNAGWIRIDPENEEALNLIRKNTELEIRKSPHDMQPKEIFVVDIRKSEEELLAGMKSKTRYNIKLAEKHGVNAFSISNSPNYLISNQIPNPNDQISKYISEFIRLIKLTEKRKRIKFHADNYYQKMLEAISGDNLRLYTAEYEGPASTREDDRSSTRGGKIIAANLVIFYGDTATYLHGATDDEYRNVMAPYLLQWQAIQDAKKMGCVRYDFGGIKSEVQNSRDWSGITKFKVGFAPKTEPVRYPGSFDLVIDSPKYFIYRIASRLINIFSSLGR